MASLREKIVQLGREYYPSEVSFPVEYLVSELEARNFHYLKEGDWPDSDWFWVCDSMLKVGVEYRNLFTYYSDLFDREVTKNGSAHPNSLVKRG